MPERPEPVLPFRPRPGRRPRPFRPWPFRPRPFRHWHFTLLALVGLFAVALAAPWLAPHDPNEQLDRAAKLLAPGSSAWIAKLPFGELRAAERVERTATGVRLWNGERATELAAERVLNLDDDGVADRRVFVLGTDDFGRDVLSRWLYGARVSLSIAFLSMSLALSLGVAIGALAALGPSWLDTLLMRAVDALLAFPALVLLLALAALYPPDLGMLVLYLGCTTWMPISRLARAEIARLRRREMVLAARGLGMGEVAIFFRHVLPNASTPLAVDASLRVGYVILTEAALSFLGLGVQPPHASWGTMIAGGRPHLADAWWLILFPSLGLVLTVVLLNLLADQLRDALDPRRAPADPETEPGPPPEPATASEPRC